MRILSILIAAAASSAILSAVSTASLAEPLGFAGPFQLSADAVEQALPDQATAEPEPPRAAQPAARLRRQIVDYPTHEAARTIVIDTPNTYLYYVLGQGRAIRYGIGVGREGFTWSGVQKIARKQEWPDWYPPAEMIERQPYLPRMMAGGPDNPLGARAMYLGNTVYRIHGTNAPDTIGKRVSSGCIRLLNDDVADLFDHVSVGTKVVVLPMNPQSTANFTERDPSNPQHVRAAAADHIGAHRLY